MNNLDVNRINEIAKTIQAQILCGGKNRMIWFSWGARNSQAIIYNNSAALAFRVSGFKHKGWVVVAYNEGRDLYDIYLLNMRKIVKKVIEGVYNEDLCNTIDYNIETQNQNSEKYTSQVNSWLRSL